MKTEKVTKEVCLLLNEDDGSIQQTYWATPDSVFAENGPWIKATLTYEVPREAMRVELVCYVDIKDEEAVVIPYYTQGNAEALSKLEKKTKYKATFEEVVE